MVYRRAARHFDYLLLLFAGGLVAFGGLLIYSAHLSSHPEGVTFGHPLTKQLVFAGIGICITFAIAWLDYRIFGQMAVGLYAIAILMLIAVLFIGDSVYGSRRWFTFAGQQIQASEVAKLFVIVALARYLADRQAHIKEIQVFVISLAMAALPAGLVLVEPDMGTAMVFGAVWVGMVLMAGVPARHVLTLTGLVVSMIPFGMLVVLGEYQRERIRLFFDPNSDPLGGGYNILQGELSIGSGGIFGRGITEGPQTQLDFLQTSTTDYIFAVLGEETGLIGAIVLLGLFTLLLFRGIRAASISRDQFGQLIATGIVIMILFQVFINIAVNIRLVPVTGIPLPFVSQGGSSLITLFAALGLLEGIVLRHRQIEF
jgi:rod shape determining protein RodA